MMLNFKEKQAKPAFITEQYQFNKTNPQGELSRLMMHKRHKSVPTLDFINIRTHGTFNVRGQQSQVFPGLLSVGTVRNYLPGQ